MSQVVFSDTTTKAQGLAGINSNFTEVYGSLMTQAASIAGKEPSLGNPSQNGYVLSSTTGGARSWVAVGGTGTVTSVAMTVPTAVFSVSGSPITASGTLAVTLATQSANSVWAGPTTGSAATPTFRSLVAADINGLYPTFSNVQTTPSTLTFGSTTAVDFSSNGYQTVTLTGNITFTSSNLAAGRSITVRIIGDSTSRTLAFPSWKFVGAAAPSALAGSKVGIFTVTSFGTTDAAVVAAYAVQP